MCIRDSQCTAPQPQCTAPQPTFQRRGELKPVPPSRNVANPGALPPHLPETWRECWPHGSAAVRTVRPVRARRWPAHVTTGRASAPT
eukprot:4130392-Alexandrium_andersonii.AAC.1